MSDGWNDSKICIIITPTNILTNAQLKINEKKNQKNKKKTIDNHDKQKQKITLLKQTRSYSFKFHLIASFT